MYLYNIFVCLVVGNEVDANDLSLFIGHHFADLYKEVVARGLNPTVWLIDKMLFSELKTHCKTIKKFIPDFDLKNHLKPGDPCAQRYCMDLVKNGDITPDYAVRMWPTLLSPWQKDEIGASPDVIVETNERLSDSEAIRLIMLGANPDMVNAKASLSMEQKIKYGVSPRLILSCMPEHSWTIYKHITTLLQNGLEPEKLVEADLKTLSNKLRVNDRWKIFDWYLEHLGLLAEYAWNDKLLLHKYLELTKDIIMWDGMPIAEEGRMLIKTVEGAIDAGLMTANEGVEYLYEYYDRDDYDDETWDEIVSLSPLYDLELLRKRLVR